ncbi:MAG TPA: nitroreductase/quinone reductase family protein [Pseudonocardiaceae bacterium]|jgi:deazaflavin-dependent oxidoreductase (nitroreductase family)|nr:nitroreductase/quinone reductase family protein [Pseudonocardiaceae bacterium]
MNTDIIDEFRRNHGVVGGHFEGKNLVIVHVTGRKSGIERLYPLIRVDDGDSYAVVGSLGGAPKDPEWVANIEVMDETVIEVGDDTIKVKPTVLRAGPERDRLYEKAVEHWPAFRESYEKKTDRTFPIVRLDPIS